MTELSKFINLLIEYEEKVEGHLNKKYKPFIRKVVNLETLAKNVSQNKVVLTKELIVFKLGLEAKSHKAVETSLNYLLKLFQFKFIDLNLPDYSQQYSIEESGVKEVQGKVPTQEVRHQLIALMRHCLHYKSTDINQLVVKVLQFLITQPILDLILDAAVEYPQDSTSTLLTNFFSFRFHVYEQICCYTEAEMKTFSTLSLHSQKVEKEMKRAEEQHQLIQDLVGRYMVEYLSILDGSGGRYGKCVICSEPAEHYCKVTKASLCGIDCKKKHIQLAQKQYKHYFQSIHLWQSIYKSFTELLIFLGNHESPTVFGVLSYLLEKPYLFMIVKQPFRMLISKHVPSILGKILLYRNESSFQHIYYFMASLTKYWLFECIAPVEYFFKQYIIKILEQKKPSYRFLNLIFKSLARMLEHGKVTIQLYINFDCEVNKDNILEKVLFELAKIVQDRYAQTSSLSKQERQSVKNHCLSLFIIMSMGLNQYRKHQIKDTQTQNIIQLKQKKMSLQQFVVRFNEHWTSGLKTLFNLNLVGLDSNEEIVDIFINLKGLSKQVISQYFSCEKGDELYEIFLSKITQKNKNSLFLTLVDLFHYIPIKSNSICFKKFIKYLEHHREIKVEKDLELYVNFLSSSYNQEDFRKFIQIRREYEVIPQDVDKLFVYTVETKQQFTAGNHTTYFTYCCSHNYLDVIANQIALLQIPISYLLENDYEIQRILNLTEELIQICPHSNWLSLLIKNSALDRYPAPEFDQHRFRIVMGVLNIMEKQAHFIQNWSTIVHFVAQLHNLLTAISNRRLVQGKLALSERLNLGIVERCLMQAGVKSDKFFGKLMLAVISVAREQIEKDQTFMANKFFQLMDNNSKKFLLVVQDFIPYLLAFTKQLQNSSPQICISVADMLKQSLAKLLKAPKSNNQKWDRVEAEFWQLFLNLSNNKNREVSDFVVNCITMSVLNHYDLSYPSWIALFSFMKNNVKGYRQQVYTIIEKIVSQKMRNCEEFYNDLVDICLELVHPQETKISIEALHALKEVVQITTAIKLDGAQGNQDQESRVRQEINSLLVRVLERIISFIFYYAHECVMESFFKLLKVKVKQQSILKLNQIDELIRSLFVKIEEYEGETLIVAQKTINYALNWGVNNKYYLIVSFFEGLVVDKYATLSLSALKCIKTYIQMLNPKSRDEWLHIQASLLTISKNTHIIDSIDLTIRDRFKDYSHSVSFDDQQLRVNLNLFANKMVAQKCIVQMLPNHLQCLDEILTLYNEVIDFNDNLYLRCLLWRRGLGSQDSSKPPNLLSLQEAISGKIIGIYSSNKQDEDIVEFAIKVCRRYCEASRFLRQLANYALKINQNEPFQQQNAQLLKQDVTNRRVPLMRVISYFLPKFTRFCKIQSQRKQVVLWLVECCKFVENREPFLKAIRQLTRQ